MRPRRRRPGSFPAIAAFLAVWGCDGTAPPGPRAAVDVRPGVSSLHLLLRIQGDARNGELGFRFGPPRDVDGDGIADIAAGARFTELQWTQMGTVSVWSSAGGKRLAHWEGDTADALFGHSVLVGSRIGGGGGPCIIASAPQGKYEGVHRGVIQARSALSGGTLWKVRGEPGEALGWQLALAGDQNGDGVEDLFAGAPGIGARGMAYLLDGGNGSTLRAYPASEAEDQFGWYVSAVADLDGDGLQDLLVGAPSAKAKEVPRVGAAHVLSSAGRRLHVWRGREANAQFGEVVTGLPDFDGDGLPEVAVSATSHPYLTRDDRRVGEVTVFSGASDREIHRFSGRQSIELYGRMIVAAGDVDGDRVSDIAIGAPWSRIGTLERAGRFEVRSGRTGEVVLSAEGDRAEMWLGWHISPAEGLGEKKERGLVVSALRSEEKGLVGAGALHVYAFREASTGR